MNNQDSQTATRDPADAEAGTADAGGAHEQLSREQLLMTLEAAKAKADQHWNQLLLARAETENVRRRADSDVEGAHKYAHARFLNELLPVTDSLELGLAAASGEGDLAKISDGMEMTLKILS